MNVIVSVLVGIALMVVGAVNTVASIFEVDDKPTEKKYAEERPTEDRYVEKKSTENEYTEDNYTEYDYYGEYDDTTPRVTPVNIQLPTVMCEVIPHPAPGSSLVDCRYGTGGQKGFVSNDIDIDYLLVEVYDQNGERKIRRFLKNPPDTLRRYVQGDVNQDPWVLNHRKLRPFLIEDTDVVQVVSIGLGGATNIYEDSALQTKKEGVLGSPALVRKDISVKQGIESISIKIVDKVNDSVDNNESNNVDKEWKLPRASDYDNWEDHYPGVDTK